MTSRIEGARVRGGGGLRPPRGERQARVARQPMQGRPAEEDLVSVLMASYNYGRYIEQAVRSVWAQDYRPIELVVVDDGSSDDTLGVLARLRAQSPMPMTVVESPHRGVSGALNLGLAECRGEFVSLLHADDFYREDKVRRQVQSLVEAGPDTVVSHSEYRVVDADGKPTGYTSAHDVAPVSGDVLEDLLYLRGMIRPMTTLYRKWALLQIGGYDDRYPTEDWVSSLRLAALGRVAHVDAPLVSRRVHGSNLGSTSARRREFTAAHYGHDALVEVTPPHVPIDRVLAIHASTVMRHSLATGGWERAGAAARHVWREFPRQRMRLLGDAASGLRSWLWQRYGKDVIPARAREALLAYKARRQLAQRPRTGVPV